MAATGGVPTTDVVKLNRTGAVSRLTPNCILRSPRGGRLSLYPVHSTSRIDRMDRERNQRGVTKPRNRFNPRNQGHLRRVSLRRVAEVKKKKKKKALSGQRRSTACYLMTWHTS
eukprot:4684918-Prymnesium_polylepis.1